jgi:hypothetical protein
VLTSVIVPETGAKISDAAFTLSTAPINSVHGCQHHREKGTYSPRFALATYQLGSRRLKRGRKLGDRKLEVKVLA